MTKNIREETVAAQVEEQPALVPSSADSMTIPSPPDTWNAIDQDSYDSFPASDPPGWIPQQLGC